MSTTDIEKLKREIEALEKQMDANPFGGLFDPKRRSVRQKQLRKKQKELARLTGEAPVKPETPAPAKKAPPKKPAKKVTKKKLAAKKPTAKKATAKKTTTRKTAAKKPALKKTAKKTTARKAKKPKR